MEEEGTEDDRVWDPDLERSAGRGGLEAAAADRGGGGAPRGAGCAHVCAQKGAGEGSGGQRACALA